MRYAPVLMKVAPLGETVRCPNMIVPDGTSVERDAVVEDAYVPSDSSAMHNVYCESSLLHGTECLEDVTE
jgi:hypothetical protein